ncbi:hypothetical protein D3C79_810450 [compost metagenome]
MHHAERVFHGDCLRAFGLLVDVGTAKARQDQCLLAVNQMAAVELGADLHGQFTATQGLCSAFSIRRGLGKIATKADEHFGLAGEHGANRFHGIVTVMTWHLEAEAALQRIEQGNRRALVDAHGAVALHVTMAAHWAQARTGHTEVAAQQHQVGDFLDGRHRMAMLGDTHGPAHDDLFRLAVHACGVLDLGQGQA